MKRLLNSSEVC